MALGNPTERVLAGIGLLCGVGALAFAIASRTPPAAPAAMSSKTRATQSAAPAEASVTPSAAGGLLPWPDVARRLRSDLRLDARQAAALEAALAACEEAIESASRHPDALWRDRLEKRARRDAYEKLVAVLKGEQQADFKQWLAATAHQNMVCWFYSDSNCGCGGKKK